jgi:hypothetical protein
MQAEKIDTKKMRDSQWVQLFLKLGVFYKKYLNGYVGYSLGLSDHVCYSNNSVQCY